MTQRSGRAALTGDVGIGVGFGYRSGGGAHPDQRAVGRGLDNTAQPTSRRQLQQDRARVIVAGATTATRPQRYRSGGSAP